MTEKEPESKRMIAKASDLEEARSFLEELEMADINLVHVEINEICLVENRPFMKIPMAKEKDLYLLIDTGAQVSIIKEEEFYQIKIKI